MPSTWLNQERWLDEGVKIPVNRPTDILGSPRKNDPYPGGGTKLQYEKANTISREEFLELLKKHPGKYKPFILNNRAIIPEGIKQEVLAALGEVEEVFSDCPF